MRIAIAKTVGGVDHYSTSVDEQGAHMEAYDTDESGILIDLGNADSRFYPWHSILFIDKFAGPR